MGAAVRGGAKGPAKPRPKASPVVRGAALKRGRAAARTYAPAKTDAARHPGLSPKLALAVAGSVIALGLMVAALAVGRHEGGVKGMAGMGMARQLAALGFRLQAVHVQGAPDVAQADILRAANLFKDQPILSVDLDDLRSRIEAVGWVKKATVVRLLPNTIVIAVVPRHPQAVWQHQGATRVVDTEGKVIAEADPGRFSDLPLVVGEGADEQAGAILPLLQGRPKLMSRIEALVRVDGRRWDLRMKDGGLIQLPAVGEDSALIQLDQLDQKARVLELGFARIDLRDPDMVAVRPKEAVAPGSPQGPPPSSQ
jgi:cell division protein FtsQ